MKSVQKDFQKGVIHIFPLLVIAFVFGFFIFKTAKETQVITSGSQVLSKSNRGPETAKGNQGSGGSSSGGDVNFSEVRVKTNEKGRARERVYRGNREVRLQATDGESTVAIEEVVGVELDESGEIEVIGEESGDVELEIQTDNGDFVIHRKRVAARTHFPLSINSETNELIVTTPSGTKVVAVLPDTAIANMLRNDFLDVAGGGSGNGNGTATGSGEIENGDGETATESGEAEEGSEIELTEEQGELVYKIKGIKNKKLFGLFGIRVPRTIIVSAETGEALNIERSVFATLLEILSF